VAGFISCVPLTQSVGIWDFAPVAPQQFVGVRVPTEAESSRAILPAARFVTRRRKMTSKSVDWIGYLAAALMVLSCLQGRHFTHYLRTVTITTTRSFIKMAYFIEGNSVFKISSRLVVKQILKDKLGIDISGLLNVTVKHHFIMNLPQKCPYF
jgi:hypothetical protein